MGGLLHLLLSAMAAIGQDGQQTGEFKISTEIDLVLLDVSVTHGRSGNVSGLNKENFRIYEDGVLQRISEFASVDTPVAWSWITAAAWDRSGYGLSMLVWRSSKPEIRGMKFSW